MWRRMQLLVRSCNHASNFVGHGSAGLPFWGKKRRVVRYGKPLQYTLAAESFCSCHIVLFGTVFVLFIWFTTLCFRGLMEGYAALWTATSWMSLARKLLPCFHFSSARSQVRGHQSTRHTSRTVRTGVRVPPGPPTGGEPNSDCTSRPSHGGKKAGGATQHRTTVFRRLPAIASIILQTVRLGSHLLDQRAAPGDSRRHSVQGS